MSYDFTKMSDSKIIGRDRFELPMYDFQADTESKDIDLPVLMDAIFLANDDTAEALTVNITDEDTTIGGKDGYSLTLIVLAGEALYTKTGPFSTVSITAAGNYRYAFFCGKVGV